MGKISLSRKIEVVAGLLISSSGFFWLAFFAVRPHEILARIGFVSAVLCAQGSLMFFWAACFAYFVRRWTWSPRACVWAGIFIAIPGVLLIIIDRPHSMAVGTLLVSQAALTGLICKKLAYPSLTDEQGFGPEPPPSLLHK